MHIAVSQLCSNPPHHATFHRSASYSPHVRPFYPHSPHLGEWLHAEASALEYEASRRERVSTILERQNASWNASPETFANLEAFFDAGQRPL